MAQETMREYLVSLGFKLDEKSFVRVGKKLDLSENKFENFSSNVGKNLKTASKVVVLALASITKALVNLVAETAKADLATERLARKLWTTKDNARAFADATSALGMSADPTSEEFLFMTEEEYARLIRLKKEAMQIEPPSGLESSLKKVRDLLFEFSRFKLNLQYVLRWAQYYFLKYIDEPLDQATGKARNFNDYIQKNMPRIGEIVGKIFYIIYRLASTVAVSFEKVFGLLDKLFSKLPKGLKAASGLVLGFVGLFKLGPIGAFIAAILALLLILDDLYTYQEGGKALFADFWQVFGDWKENLDPKIVDQFTESIGILGDGIWDLVTGLGKVVTKLAEFGAKQGYFSNFLYGLSSVASYLGNALSIIGDAIGLIANGDFSAESWSGIGSRILEQWKNTPGVIYDALMYGTPIGATFGINPDTGDTTSGGDFSGGGGGFGGHGASRGFGTDDSGPSVTPNAYSGGALGPLVMAYNRPAAVPDVYAGDTHLTVNVENNNVVDGTRTTTKQTSSSWVGKNSSVNSVVTV